MQKSDFLMTWDICDDAVMSMRLNVVKNLFLASIVVQTGLSLNRSKTVKQGLSRDEVKI